jgi:hypothetical protein
LFSTVGSNTPVAGGPGMAEAVAGLAPIRFSPPAFNRKYANIPAATESAQKRKKTHRRDRACGSLLAAVFFIA